MEKHIVCNRIQTPDGTVLRSYHVHDYRVHYDTVSHEEYMVDGGLDYMRRNENLVPYIEQSVYSDEPFSLIREVFCWGSYGKNGDLPLHYIALSQMSNAHIESILKTQKQIGVWVRDLLETELQHREHNPETVVIE